MKKPETMLVVVLCLVIIRPFAGQGDSFIEVTGRVGSLARKLRIAFTSDDAPTPAQDAICRGAAGKPEEVVRLGTDDAAANFPNRITAVTVHESSTNNYTTFVAVDPGFLTACGGAIGIRKPVPVPDGVRYETTVQD